ALLFPYVSALPEGTNINVNTASSHVLAALLNTSESAANALVNDRMAYPFNSSSEFAQRAVAKGIAVPDQGALAQMLSINSQYFLLKTTAVCNNSEFISYSFIERVPNSAPKVYQRTQEL
ncbi:MAG: type II secretion system protein GspK, partial [Gammaproteobacteria bacterium]